MCYGLVGTIRPYKVVKCKQAARVMGSMLVEWFRKAEVRGGENAGSVEWRRIVALWEVWLSCAVSWVYGPCCVRRADK